MIQNRHNLPAPFVALFQRRQYSKGDSHWSVSQLVQPPKISVLRDEYADAIGGKADLAEQFWSLMGSNIHKILENYNDDNHTVEERIFTTIDGMRISGQIDLQSHGNAGRVGIVDYKFTSVYSVSKPKPEWEHQLNAYAYLVRRERGLTVESLHVCAILRDWRAMDVQRRTNYPPAPVVMVEIPLWTFAAQEEWVTSRVRGLVNTSTAHHLGEELPACTDEDRWLRDGDPIRCRNFCDVRDYCSQWADFTRGESENEEAKSKVPDGPRPKGRGRPRKKTRGGEDSGPANGEINAADPVKDPE